MGHFVGLPNELCKVSESEAQFATLCANGSINI